MPLYQYHCKACNHHYELTSSCVDCPDCKRELQLIGYDGVTLNTMSQIAHVLSDLQKAVVDLESRMAKIDDGDDGGSGPETPSVQ